jgi:hypothetical protein
MSGRGKRWDRGETTYILIVKLWISPSKLMEHITSEVFEPIPGQCSQFLSSLIPFGMKVVSNGQERD